MCVPVSIPAFSHPEGAGESAVCPSPSRFGTWHHLTPSEGVAKSRQFPTPSEGVDGPFPAHAICRPCRTVFLEVRHYTPSEGVAKSRPLHSFGRDGQVPAIPYSFGRSGRVGRSRVKEVGHAGLPVSLCAAAGGQPVLEVFGEAGGEAHLLGEGGLPFVEAVGVAVEDDAGGVGG